MADIEVKTPEKIARHYQAAMDSVTLLDAVAADPDAYADDPTVVARNVEHLKRRFQKLRFQRKEFRRRLYSLRVLRARARLLLSP